MLSEPIYLRFENMTPPHKKFYEIEVELCWFYPKRLIRRWGRIGSRRPRSLRMMMADAVELQRQVSYLTNRRRQHGYRQVMEIGTLVLGGSAA